ncbi:MAG: hypothetical protein M3R06_02965 [Chloroflexota bacterium]|nr:hypothetical protein [Chloroflexota bacterium]
MSGQAIVWFGIAGGGAAFALSLLHARYVRRTPQAIRSRGSFTLFALLMLLFALGAAAAGYAALRAG